MVEREIPVRVRDSFIYSIVRLLGSWNGFVGAAVGEAVGALFVGALVALFVGVVWHCGAHSAKCQ